VFLVIAINAGLAVVVLVAIVGLLTRSIREAEA
jgi:hypothetical protein